MTVKINTRIPFFLWRMTSREAEINNGTITTTQMVPNKEGEGEVEVTYTNTLEKAQWWLIALIKYIPILLILLTADWGYRLWNGIGMFFSALYMLWYFWMSEHKPEHFYPVSIAALIVLLSIGLFTGTLLYANHILSDIVYLFLLKLLYDDYSFKTYERYYAVEGKTGMFVYVPVSTKYAQKHKNQIQYFLVGIIALSLIMIAANGAMLFKEYRDEKAQMRMLEELQKKEDQAKHSMKAQIINTPKVDENLTQEQVQLREELGIEVMQ